MAPTKLDPDTHVQDSDCVIDSMTGLCLICGVDHSEPCVVCGGRGFHKALCPQMPLQPTLPHGASTATARARTSRLFARKRD